MYLYVFVGAYVFIETSKPRQRGDKAQLVSPVFQAGKERCITFWYHMYGLGIGTLNVVVTSPNNKKSATLWSLAGNKGDKWFQATVSIPALDWTQDYQVCYTSTNELISSSTNRSRLIFSSNTQF